VAGYPAYSKALKMVHRDFVPTTTELIVTAGETPKRLDLFLASREPSLSRAALQRLIEGGHITVNGKRSRASYKIRPGDNIALVVPRAEPLELRPEPIPLNVLYEDEAVLVLDKPVGLVVHPAPGHWSGTLVNALLHHFGRSGIACSTIGGKERPGLVHRLDKETTGVMVIAKTDAAHKVLAAQFKSHTITRRYEALVWGILKKSEGLIESAIGRDVKARKKFSSRTARPKISITEYRVLNRLAGVATRVELRPRTGRTHQIRVHLAELGHPVLGDVVYGGRKVAMLGMVPIARVMLHAKMLGFIHPSSAQYMEFSVPCPADMNAVQAAIQAEGTEGEIMRPA